VSFFAFKVIAIFIRFPGVPFYIFNTAHGENLLFQLQFNLLLKEKIHLETQTSSLDVLVYGQEGIALPGATVTVTQPEGLKQTVEIKIILALASGE
jgi:hypothetical protein